MDSRNLFATTSEQRLSSSEIIDLAQPTFNSQQSSHEQQYFLLDYWRVLVKRRWVVLGTLVFMLAAAVIISLHATPTFRAQGQITIYRENPNPLGFKENTATNGGDSDDVYVDLATQVRILKSTSLAVLAVQKLQSNAQFKGWMSTAPDMKLSSSLTGAPQLTKEQQDAVARRFDAGLEVAVIPDTRVVEIAYISPEPRAAADAVNALIQAYIEQNLESRFEATTQAASWLTKQLSDLQIKSEISEEKLVRYQKDHGIVGTDDKQNVITSKLDDLNKQLTEAEADRIQKQATYQLTLSGDPEAITAVSQNNFLQTLRMQQAALNNELAQDSVQLGTAYPKVIELNNRMQQLDDTITAELKKTIARIHNDYVGSVTREQMFRQAFERQKNDASELSQNAIEYNLLKRDADSNRQLYDSLMQKLKEAGLSAALSSTNVHIVDAAGIPPVPFTPDIPRNLGIGFLIGLTGGVALAFVVEAFDSTVRTPEQAEASAFLPSLAVIPFATNGVTGDAKNGRRLQPSRTQKSDDVVALAYRRPNSAVAEAYRGLRTSILLSLADSAPQLILVTSPLPQDGKTTTSINSAVVMAQEGRRVLLVDADLRRPSISKTLGIAAGKGLTTVLAGNASSESVILPSPQLPNLFVMPAGPVTPCPSELLSSEKMKNLLTEWRKMFDHVIIDSSPVLACTDAVRLSVEVDAVLLVVRSAQTSKAALRRASGLLAQVKAHVLGVVVNGIDLSSSDHDRYYYSNAKYYGAEEPETM
jgi:polysaccharide biosynthesis transport protein